MEVSPINLDVEAECQPDPTLGSSRWRPSVAPIEAETLPEKAKALPPILRTNRQAAEPLPRPYDKRAKGKPKGFDEAEAALGEPQWQLIYEAYAETGDPDKISEMINVPADHVRHVLKYGVRRLGLPSIEAHAVNKAEVALRLQEAGLNWKGTDEGVSLNKPEVQDAIQARVAKEAIAAQTLLSSGLTVAEAFSKLLAKVKRKIESGLLSMPDEIDLSYLNKITLSMEKLAKAIDIATRLARLTAGEPETHVLHHVTGLLGFLSPDEIHALASTGEIPRSLRGRAAGMVIDIVPEGSGSGSDD